ncbi:putative lipoprotein [Burkholderia sp. ABCPW 111]|nr:putative lipoprotein [Burkholderia sp. ABCPW 111]
MRIGDFGCGPSSFFAITSCRAARNDAACAFERPSASASAKFANSTVNHSHSATARMKPAGASASPRSAAIHRTVVRMLPTYTQNITGLRNCVRGASLRNESTKAGRTMAGSNIERAARRACPRLSGRCCDAWLS